MSDKKMKPSITHSALPFIGKATEMKPSTCPYCGLKAIYKATTGAFVDYDCGTTIFVDCEQQERTAACYAMELNKVKFALREVVKVWENYIEDESEPPSDYAVGVAIAAAAKLIEKTNG